MSTKINVRSPFFKKYTATNLRFVELSIYIYSGTKTTDKGTVKYKLRKYPLSGNNYVTFNLADIIRDYIKPNASSPLNSNIDYVKWVQLEDTIISDFVPDCTDITGFAVAQDGTITKPTSSSGTQDINSFNFVDVDNFGSETTPPSYNANTTGSPITRTVRVNINIPSGFYESGNNNALCVLTADQPSAATAYCKAYRVTNSSSTETGSLSYTSCDGQQSIVYTIPTSSTIDICVYPADPYTFGVPTISGSGVSYIDLNQACTTDTLS